MANTDTYADVRILEFPGMTVRVHSPRLTEQERQRRMQEIHKQAEKLLREEDLYETRKEAHSTPARADVAVENGPSNVAGGERHAG